MISKKLIIATISLGIFLGASHASAESERPSLMLRVDPNSFSPNEDGTQDQTFLYPVLSRSQEALRWRVDITKANGSSRVARLSGPGFPALVPWGGVTRKGTKALDGLYEARFYLWTKEGRLSAQRQFRVDTAPPQVSLSVSNPVLKFDGSGATNFTLTPTAADSSAIERWQLQVLNFEGRTIHVAWSTGPVTPVEWNGADRATGVLAPRGRYRAAFQAWDAAGNGSEAAFVDLSIEVTPQEVVRRAIKRIRLFETSQGVIVQLPADQLFIPRRGRPVLSENGLEILHEAAILIHASPDSTVDVDGYSQGLPSGDADRDRSSLYAWTVYSYLVKQESVSASRLSPRGRGRSPMFSRRSVDPTVIRNGVEIVLRGQTW